MKRISYSWLVLLLMVTIPACTPPVPAEPTEEQIATSGPVIIRAAVSPFISNAPFFIALDEGFFEEQNLTVEIVRVDGSSQALPLLAQGEIDIYGGIINAGLFNAMSGGADIRIVADKGYPAAEGCVVEGFVISHSLAESGELSGPADLEGLQIDTSPASVEGFFLEKMLSGTSLTLDDFTFEEMPTSIQPEALEAGSLDVVMASEPWVTRIEQQGAGQMWMPLRDIYPDFQTGYLAYGANLINDHRDVGDRFMIAYRKAVLQYMEGKTERNLDILERNFELDRDLLNEVCLPHFRQDSLINTQSMIDFQNWAVDQELMEATLAPEEFWDPSFVMRANETLGQ